MLHLAWSMRVDGARLRVAYELANAGRAPVLVVERLVWNGGPDPDVCVVRNDREPGAIAFTRALVMTDEKVLHVPLPAVCALAPGATLGGAIVGAWPPFAWHNFSRVRPLAADATRAVLEIGYIDDPAASLVGSSAPPGYLTATAWGAQRLVRGALQPLPPR